MSASALGDTAVVGKLIATEIESSGVALGRQYDNTDTVLATTGFHKISSSGGAVALSLPDAARSGDIVELLHVAGGNVAVITPVNLRGTAVSLNFTVTAGGYAKLIFISTTWYILARSSDAVAAAAAVANLPAVV